MVERDPEPLSYDPAQAREFVGSYGNDAMTLVVAAHETGMTLEVGIKPGIRAASEGGMPPDTYRS